MSNFNGQFNPPRIASEIPHHKTSIGTCSQCGGPVCVNRMWGSVVPDTPTCARCGATPAEQFGPVIPMRRSQP